MVSKTKHIRPNNLDLKAKVKLPSSISTVFTVFALILVPWTIYLAYTLPTRHIEKHWDVAWVGLDIAIIFLLLITGILATLKSQFVIISLVATSSFLIVDAWFDIISSPPGGELFQSVFLAVCVEIPLAFICLVLAYHIISDNTR
jgi:hypothetical protein